MSSQTTLNKLNHEIKDMKHEIDMLRSFAISVMGKDPEGEYRPEFVREIMRASSEKPAYTFRGKSSFLAELRRRRPQ